jgi:hypothetical protein
MAVNIIIAHAVNSSSTTGDFSIKDDLLIADREEGSYLISQGGEAEMI